MQGLVPCSCVAMVAPVDRAPPDSPTSSRSCRSRVGLLLPTARWKTPSSGSALRQMHRVISVRREDGEKEGEDGSVHACSEETERPQTTVMACRFQGLLDSLHPSSRPWPSQMCACGASYCEGGAGWRGRSRSRLVGSMPSSAPRARAARCCRCHVVALVRALTSEALSGELKMAKLKGQGCRIEGGE